MDKKKANIPEGNCESCLNYEFDEEYDCYSCIMDLDEDEMRLFIQGSFKACPYYRFDNEYSIVHKQI